jgi:protein subunit release factor A
MKIEVRSDGVGVAEGRFFDDICGMVEAISLHGGNLLEVVSSDPAGRQYVGDHGCAARLVSLAGVHRAQFVPERSATGRIVTEKVAVVVGEVESASFIPTDRDCYVARVRWRSHG